MKKIRFLIEYVGMVGICNLLKLLPYSGIRALAGFSAWVGFYCFPGTRRIVLANIATAMPEVSPEERRRIARSSYDHLMLNLLEFLWLDGSPERIRARYVLPPEIDAELRRLTADNGRIIFVNPHLGSWEASGVMAPFYADVFMAAIAKPLRNPLLNRKFNFSGREKVKGLKIIFSNGAMKAAIKALREGLSLGTLIDQNTKGRAGGIFVNFFGMPVPSSAAPAVLKSFCDAHDIPATIVFGTSIRTPDGKITAKMELLPRPFGEYAGEKEVLQELMNISEKYIRLFPEQYLWVYRRFQYIPDACPEATAARYPFYAGKVTADFFHR